MAAIYSNENFPKRVVEELRRLGHDVLTSYEAGRAKPISRLGFAGGVMSWFEAGVTISLPKSSV